MAYRNMPFPFILMTHIQKILEPQVQMRHSKTGITVAGRYQVQLIVNNFFPP